MKTAEILTEIARIVSDNAEHTESARGIKCPNVERMEELKEAEETANDIPACEMCPFDNITSICTATLGLAFNHEYTDKIIRDKFDYYLETVSRSLRRLVKKGEEEILFEDYGILKEIAFKRTNEKFFVSKKSRNWNYSN